jgi:peptide/nickel transport system substrate-binding protein
MPNTTRRALLGASASLPLLPALARSAKAQAGKVLRFVPQADLSALDPIWTTGYVVRNHGYMVYDTLYSMDSRFQLKPQMAEGHEVTDEGRTWTIRLRPGLKFHDGEPVRARDCVASIKRWAARDGFGATLMARTDELSAVDDRTLRFRLKSPFPLLAEALGKLSSPVPFIMPERLASTSPQEQIREAIGSGPFRFLKDEWVAGSNASYAKFDGYVPREEAADGAAGGKRVHVDRVEWKIIPDTSTAVSALSTGQVDWIENASADLLPILRRSNDITVTMRDPLGVYVLLRFNALYPPFDDVKVRQAVLHALNQPDYLQAMTDPKLEELRNTWFAADGEAAQKTIAAEMERQAFQTVAGGPIQSASSTCTRMASPCRRPHAGLRWRDHGTRIGSRRDAGRPPGMRAGGRAGAELRHRLRLGLRPHRRDDRDGT